MLIIEISQRSSLNQSVKKALSRLKKSSILMFKDLSIFMKIVIKK
jgi:hypothetical protein